MRGTPCAIERIHLLHLDPTCGCSFGFIAYHWSFVRRRGGFDPTLTGV